MNEPRETFDVESPIKIKLFVNGPYFYLILSFMYTFTSKYMYSVLVSNDSYWFVTTTAKNRIFEKKCYFSEYQVSEKSKVLHQNFS